MIIFFNKKTGKVIGNVDGRIHDKIQMGVTINDGKTDPKDVGKLVIGWEEKGNKRIEHNMEHFALLQDFESNSLNTPFQYKIIRGKLTKPNDNSQGTEQPKTKD